MLDHLGPTGAPWRQQPFHRAWLRQRAEGLLAWSLASLNPRGGFSDLDDDGRPLLERNGDCARGLPGTTRMVFSYALGHLLGYPGSSRMVDHGVECLLQRHRDTSNGGYFWEIRDDGPADPSKQAYGHAFVLLAGAAAKQVGHPDADLLITDALTVLRERFWESQHGAAAEEFSADWQPLGAPYRGQNSNMHLTEALMAAYEATGERECLAMAESIADLIIRRLTAAEGFRLPEHFTANWEVDRTYSGSEMLRPAGTTPGHWLEWSRLLVQLWIAGGRTQDWMPEAAMQLFRRAVEDGWDTARGGLFYTLDWSGKPLVTDKIWWPLCEGIGAAVFLDELKGSEGCEVWYRRIWGYIGGHVLDTRAERWIPQLDVSGVPKSTLFTGRPAHLPYHSLQACLIPLLPARGSLLAELSRAPGAPQ